MSADLLAIIPARGGSKRIPHKNIKDFLGKPLIAYSIENALKSNLFKDVIVSSDDDEIIKVAQEYGASAPFVRDAELSNDFTGTGPVVVDAYEKMCALGNSYSGACCIYATAPLLTFEYLIKAQEKFTQAKADYLFSACEFSFPIQRGFYQTDEGEPVAVMPECQAMRSQDLPKAYQDAGQFYFFSANYLKAYAHSLKNNTPIQAKMISRMFEMPRYRVIDIDTMEDWEYALVLANALKSLNLP